MVIISFTQNCPKYCQQLKRKEDSIIQREKTVKEDEVGLEQYRKQIGTELKNQEKELKENLIKVKELEESISNREVVLNKKEEELKALERDLQQFKHECMADARQAKISAKNCSHALKKLRFKYSELKRRSFVSDRPTNQ